MRINIAVHGRFYDFELAAALLRQGHDVRLLTNYPRRSVAKWFPAERTRGFALHGVFARVAGRISGGEPPEFVEASLKHMFGRWAAGYNAAEMPDIVHCWSGVAEESIRRCRNTTTCTVARGSSHIRRQLTLLDEEESRVGRRLEKPSSWIVAREEREYALSHKVIVPSRFARDTFLAQGHTAVRLAMVAPPARAPDFEATAALIDERIRRIRSGAPLRVLYTGLISFRKGMHDVRAVLRSLGKQVDFRFVGTVLPECRQFAADAAAVARFEGAVSENKLPDVYAWGDIFLLPTIEDGFAVVLTQAQAAGLPILTTTNCGGSDIIDAGGQGWVVPIRSPEALIQQIEWCDRHREELASMVERLYKSPVRRSWDDVARNFVEAVSA